jgi:hypothetical protein
MPTIEALREKSTSIKKSIDGKKASLDPSALRRARKRLKRTQRSARKLEARVKKAAAKPAAQEPAAG